MWEGLVGAAGEIFENQPKGRLATKIPFEGNVENPQANAWYTIAQVLQNAFIRALQPSLDNEINIQTVERSQKPKKSGLEKVFDKDDEDRQAKKDARKERRQKKKEERKKRRVARQGDEKG